MLPPITLLTLSSLMVLCAPHSWVGCTDYRGDLNFYEEQKCLGYPRRWEDLRGDRCLTEQPNGYHLACDSGYDHQVTLSAPCQTSRAEDWTQGYSATYPYAIYQTGKVHCLAHPMKNHKADYCTNSYIPDSGMWLYVMPATSVPKPETFAELTAVNIVNSSCGAHADLALRYNTNCQLSLTKHENARIDCKGFQNSPAFCSNTDAALGTACFLVPANMPLGAYTFTWVWEFNPGAPYTTCFEAEVIAPTGGIQTPLGLTGEPFDPLCVNNYQYVLNKTAPTAPTLAPSPTRIPTLAPSPTRSTQVPTPSCKCVCPTGTSVPTSTSVPTTSVPTSTSVSTSVPTDVPTSVPTDVPTPGLRGTVVPTGSRLCLYDTGCAGTGCATGLVCQVFDFWSQCLESSDDWMYRQDCVSTNNWGCNGLSCCNPSAYCAIDNICRLPCMAV